MILRQVNFFLVQLTDVTRLESANMMILSKEVTDKDRSMKSQLLIRSSPSNEDEKLSGEKVWKNNGFFKDVRPELNLEKVNLMEIVFSMLIRHFFQLLRMVILLCTSKIS